MHRDIDRTLDEALDLRAAPLLRPRRAMALALLVAVLLGWYAWEAKAKQDAAPRAKARPPAAAPN